MSKWNVLIRSIGSVVGSTRLTPEQENIRKLLWHNSSLDANQPLESLRFVVVDLETTGLRPHRDDRVLSIGATVVENGVVNEGEMFYELANPGKLIPPDISRLTGIDQQMVIDKPGLPDVLTRFLTWAGNCVVVGHVVQFDLAFLNQCLAEECGSKLKNKSIDTRSLAQSLFPGLVQYSLDEICSQFDLQIKHRHHALDDALATARILEICLKSLGHKGIRTLGDLSHFLRYHQGLPRALSL